MAKYAGYVGYIVETMVDGVYTPTSNQVFMTGDVESIRRGRDNSEGNSKVNEDITLSNRISLIGDAYAHQNFMWIRWLEWMGTKWKVSSVTLDTNSPRIKVTLGGVYVHDT